MLTTINIGRGDIFVTSMYFIPLFNFGCFTVVLVLGVLADMHNRYLSFCFLDHNISFVWLIRQSEPALLRGELAKLMCGAMVSCFPAQSCCKNPVSCGYMASICGFVSWGCYVFSCNIPPRLLVVVPWPHPVASSFSSVLGKYMAHTPFGQYAP